METKKIKAGREDRIFNITVTVISLVVLVIVLYPLYFVIIASISSPEDISLGKVRFLPSGINFAAYKFVLEEWKIWRGYLNTRKDLFGRNVITKLFVVTMFFSGGLIPTYMVVSSLHMVNTRTVLVVMGTVTVYNMIIARTFFQNSLPEELFEAAELDGCGVGKFFFKIALPCSKAIIAVIALYVGVSQWNSYFTAMIYVTDQKIYPLQLVLRDILILGQQLTQITDPAEIEALVERQKVAQIIKYVVIIVSSLPVICVYPFLQKYFVKGVMIGSVKG